MGWWWVRVVVGLGWEENDNTWMDASTPGNNSNRTHKPSHTSESTAQAQAGQFWVLLMTDVSAFGERRFHTSADTIASGSWVTVQKKTFTKW